MTYILPSVTTSHFLNKDARTILMDVVNLIEGVGHGLFFIAGEDYTIQKDDLFIESWDALIGAAATELNKVYPIDTYAVDQVITNERILENLGSGSMPSALSEILVLMQGLSFNLLLSEDYETRSLKVKEILSQYKNIRDMIDSYGTIRTAEERINLYLEAIEMLQEDTLVYAELGSQYLNTCNIYTNAVIGQPGYLDTKALRDIVALESGSLTVIDNTLLGYISDIEYKLTQLNGSHNIVLLEESEILFLDARDQHSHAGIMIDDADMNTEDCKTEAINGFLASYDYPFSPSEKIRITAVVPGPTTLSVSYAVNANAPTESILITVDDTNHIIIGYRGTQPPTINEVVSQLNTQIGTIITAENLDLSGTGGVIKANQSFVRTRLQGLVIA